jgi:putative phosphoesterase
MKIGLLGDVHGNLPALEAVVKHARQQNVEALWNLGDFVGYGPFPEQTVTLLSQIAQFNILGNYDLKVLQFKKKKKKWRWKKHPQKFLAFEWAFAQLPKKCRRYLKSLPTEIKSVLDGTSIFLTHGSPASINEPILPNTPDQRLGELAKIAGTDIIICGHTHIGFSRSVEGVWFINVGSVGRPVDGDPRAGYAVLDLSPQAGAVDHYRVPYDLPRLLNEIRQRKLPESFAQMFIQGRSLEDLNDK